MGAPARRLATYQDLLAAPPHTIAQLVGGELHVQPRPAGPHSIVASGLGFDLGNPFQRGRGGPGGWIIVFEPELHFGADVVVPDLAGWRVERTPELDASYFTVAPDWVCDVLSPSSAQLDRGPKADLYAREGVEFMWLVEPLENLIEAFRRSDAAWLRLGAWFGEASARIPPFDAIELELGPLWVKKASTEPR
jgi:Uma2 family endonuclease